MPSDAEWQMLLRVRNAFFVICLSLFVRFLFKLYKARLRMITLKNQGLSMPPHHPIFGHLLVADKILSKLPRDMHLQCLPNQLRREIPDVGPVFYLDMWPFSLPLLIVASPSAAYQLTQERSPPKSDGLRKYMRPLAQNNDLVSSEGEAWRQWRNVFNPGFSAGHLITMVPQIAKEVSTFCDVLRQHAQANDLFLMEESTVNLTMDTIGRVVLDTHFNAQKSTNEFVHGLRAQIPWLSFGAQPNLLTRWHPFRPFVHWYYTRKLDRYMGRELENRFAAHQENGEIKGAKGAKSKTVVDLALDKYLEDQPGSRATRSMDATFKSVAISQMKVFVLAGHDTTSSTLCYIYHLLSGSPSALRQVRAEHDSVFGSDRKQIVSILSENPHALNQLPYTVAIIKEAIRLFPAGSSTRNGEPGFYLEEDGRHYPTDGFIVWSLHQAIHREPLYWPDPDAFLPERWLVSKGDPLYPVKGAWRGFEFGPRNCIGQELAMLEMRIVMVMTLREFDVRSAYEEWDRGHGKPGPRTVSGERAYQVLDGTTRPADGFPCRVAMVDR